MNLIEAMAQAGLSDRDLAQRVDVSVPYIRFLRTGERKPSIHTAIGIVNALRGPLDMNPAVLGLELFPEVLEGPMALVEQLDRAQNGNGHGKVVSIDAQA